MVYFLVGLLIVILFGKLSSLSKVRGHVYFFWDSGSMSKELSGKEDPLKFAHKKLNLKGSSKDWIFLEVGRVEHTKEGFGLRYTKYFHPDHIYLAMPKLDRFSF